jgi:hypothetical protein
MGARFAWSADYVASRELRAGSVHRDLGVALVAIGNGGRIQ